MNIKKYKLLFLGLPKTLLFNFHYFPFNIAIKLPVLLTHKVRLKKLKGTVILKCNKIKKGIVRIGYSNVSINDVNEYSLWNVEGKIIFNEKVRFGAGTKIAVGKEGKLHFGKNFIITARSEIACFKEITFGDNCLLSWDILIMDTDAHLIYNKNGDRINEDKPIIIGNHVWIGCRCTILKGATIADGCLVGANTIISKKYLNKNFILIGNPAIEKKIIGKWN